MTKKSCFIATPIGDDHSEIRRAADGVIDAAIIPVMDELDFDIDVAHRMSDAGSITKQVIGKLVDFDLVICNLTSLNPNVMYELAVRHAIRKPVVCIAERGTKIPFDIQEDRIVFYDNDMKGATVLIDSLKQIIPNAETDETPDNPIYRAIESQTIIKQVKTEGGFEEYIVNSIDKLERMVGDLYLDPESTKQNKRTYYARIRLKEGSTTEEMDNLLTRLSQRLTPNHSMIDTTKRSAILEGIHSSSPTKLMQLINNILRNEQDLIEDIILI